MTPTTKLPTDLTAIRVRLTGEQYRKLKVLARREEQEPEFYFNAKAGRIIRVVLGCNEDPSIKEAAAELSVDHKTIRRKIKAGEFPNSYKVGRVYRIPRADLDAMRERCRVAIG